MKHMKKLLALMLALLMVFAMVACDSSSGGGGKGSGGGGNSAKSIAQAFADAFESGKVSKIEKLLHKDYLEAEEITSDYFTNWENEIKDVQYTIKLGDGRDLNDDEMEELCEGYQEYYGLEVEEAQVFETEATMEYDGETDSASPKIYVIKIDGEWYLDAAGMDLF